jgi:hypothetical protein
MKLLDLRRVLLPMLVIAWCGNVASGQILLTNFGAAYLQDFNTLASSGTSSSVPANWAFVESGSSANTTYTAGTGSSGTGDTYSFGSTSSTERALGELSSGTLASTFGAGFQNNGTSPITRITLSYYGEQWRQASSTTDKLDFQISFDATSITTGTWNDIDALDFSQIHSGTAGLLDGNLSANRQLKGVTDFLLSSSIAPNGTFWIRWVGSDATGFDAGLGIDDFSINAIPEPSSVLLSGAAVLAFLFAARRRRPAKLA